MILNSKQHTAKHRLAIGQLLLTINLNSLWEYKHAFKKNGYTDKHKKDHAYFGIQVLSIYKMAFHTTKYGFEHLQNDVPQYKTWF